jgi:hypothetical protein
MQESKFFGLQFTKIGLLTPEHEGITFLRNVANHLPKSALCNTPEDLNVQQYSSETGTKKEELETRLYMDCNAKEWRDGVVWTGNFEIESHNEKCCKRRMPPTQRRKMGYIWYTVEMSGARRRATNCSKINCCKKRAEVSTQENG